VSPAVESRIRTGCQPNSEQQQRNAYQKRDIVARLTVAVVPLFAHPSDSTRARVGAGSDDPRMKRDGRRLGFTLRPARDTLPA
jgi:hypothetical protein